MTVDELLFGASPYVAVAVAIVGVVWRIRSDQFSISSLSSQFLESRRLFWGSVPWHYGIIVVLLGHLVAFLIPRSILAWNGVPWRLYVLEGTALIFGLMTLVGLVLLIIRRATDKRVQAVTSSMDIVLLLVLLVQVAAGVWTAIAFRWGSSWYAAAAVPYLRSLFALQPDIPLVSNLPLVVKIHIIGAFAFVALIPFTRLMHLFFIPLSYLWRPYQVVIWNRKKASHG